MVNGIQKAGYGDCSFIRMSYLLVNLNDMFLKKKGKKKKHKQKKKGDIDGLIKKMLKQQFNRAE